MSTGMGSECATFTGCALTALAMFLLSSCQALELQKLIQLQPRNISAIIILLISVTVSASAPSFVEFGSRLRSIEGVVSTEVADTKASEGWYLKPGGHGQELRCFSCGVGSSQARHKPTCAFRSVASLLSEESQTGGGKEMPARLLTSSQVETLSQFLKGPVPGFAESYGYPRPVVAFAAVKEFWETNTLSQAVGSLIQLVQNLSDDWIEVANRVNLEPIVTKLLTGELSVAIDTDFQAAPRPAAMAMEEPKAKEDDCSDQCSVCKTSQINRVILPCRHLSACEGCLKTRELCPTCHGRIIATVVAFLC